MRRYETIFILRPNVGEEEINRVVNSTTQIILDEKGTIIELTRWGVKKLAYLIKKETLGFYIYCDFAGSPAAVAEIERKFRIDDLVLKYLTIKTADTINDEQITQAIALVAERATQMVDAEETDSETKAVEEVESEVE
jgi:small subunit ribosomal protein S6